MEIDHQGQLYRVEAHSQYVLIVPAEGGPVSMFSTDEGEPYYELARATFDGFEWNLSVLHELIDSCVQDRS